MNPDTGVFTVPVSGIYSFSFSAYTNAYEYHFLHIYVKKNGERQVKISESDFDSFANIGYSWTMSLVQNDQIQLTIIEGGLYVYTDCNFIWFNGQLLMK